MYFPPYWKSDLLPAICIVFKEPIRIAPQTDLSRVISFRQACAVKNEDSRYENGVARFVKPAQDSSYENAFPQTVPRKPEFCFDKSREREKSKAKTVMY